MDAKQFAQNKIRSTVRSKFKSLLDAVATWRAGADSWVKFTGASSMGSLWCAVQRLKLNAERLYDTNAKTGKGGLSDDALVAMTDQIYAEIRNRIENDPRFKHTELYYFA